MDNTGLSLFITALPIALILLFVYNKDKNKEPTKLLLLLFLLGCISGFITIIFSKGMSNFIPLMAKNSRDMQFHEIVLYSFLGVAFIEELCKWVMVYFAGYKNKEFDETYDSIVYAVFVSLGFAFFENILYVSRNGLVFDAIKRALLAVPGHTCNAIFMGYYLSLAKVYSTGSKKQEIKKIILSILIPTVLHGIYDFCVLANNKYIIAFFLIYISILYVISIKKLKILSENNKIISHKITFCKKCGSTINGQNCEKCEASKQ